MDRVLGYSVVSRTRSRSGIQAETSGRSRGTESADERRRVSLCVLRRASGPSCGPGRRRFVIAKFFLTGSGWRRRRRRPSMAVGFAAKAARNSLGRLLTGRPRALALAGEIRPSGELVILCRPITTCQREAKAIPLISGTDRAEISGSDCADCDGTRFAGPPFWRMPQRVLRSVAYSSEGPSIHE